MSLHGGAGGGGGSGTVSTLTTKGDLLSRSSSAQTRLAVGSDGQVLVADSASTSGVKWAAGSAGTDTSAWHQTGDSVAADSKVGNTNAGPYKLSIYNDNAEWMRLKSDGAAPGPFQSIYFGNLFASSDTRGGWLQYGRSDTWASMEIKCTQNGSAGIGTGEAQLVLTNNASAQLILNSEGGSYAGTTYGINTAGQGRIRSSSTSGLVIGTTTNVPMIFFTNDTIALTIKNSGLVHTAGATCIGTSTQNANEKLRVAGMLRADSFAAFGPDFGASDPTYSLQIRRDAADINTSIIVDNQNASGQPGMWFGKNPRGANTGCGLFFDVASDTVYFKTDSSGGFIINESSGTMKLQHNGTTRIASDGTGLGFFAHATVAQQTVGANVNNVVASGTTGQFDDFTNGTVYATDYAALHATVYQLTRTVAQLSVAVRNLGLGA